MEPRHLWTIKWTQPYTGYTPFMQDLWDRYEAVIERRLAQGDFQLAQIELERIMKL